MSDVLILVIVWLAFLAVAQWLSLLRIFKLERETAYLKAQVDDIIKLCEELHNEVSHD